MPRRKNIAKKITKKNALFLIDGVHKPDNTVYSIKELSKQHKVRPKALIWIGGTEKIKSRRSFTGTFKKIFGIKVSFPVNSKGECVPEDGIRKALSENKNIKTVVQLSGAPQITRHKTQNFARISAGLGATYIAGGTVFEEHKTEIKQRKPSIGLYATGKRTGKTAFGSYIGSLICGIREFESPWRPVIITHSRGGPPDPPLIEIHKRASSKSLEKLTLKDLLSSRFKPEYLGKLLDFGLHGASDVFEDALILSMYLDKWEERHDTIPYVSLIGCRRAGAGYFNEFVVSNVDKGIKKANKCKADIIIHEGSGAEHPPAEVDGVIFFIPTDVDLNLLEDFPGLEKAALFILANCQTETASPERVGEIKKIINDRTHGVPVILTRFVPEVVHNDPGLKNKKVALFTTAPGYILQKLSLYLKETHHCKVIGTYNSLDSDKQMKSDIDKVARKNKPDYLLFEIKARGVEGGRYAEKKHAIPYLYVNNIPQVVDEKFLPKKNNRILDEGILKAVNEIATNFNKKHIS